MLFFRTLHLVRCTFSFSFVFPFSSFFSFPHSFLHSSVGKESACNAGDPGSIPGLGRSAREGIDYPLQYSWASLVAGFDSWVGKIPWRREQLYPLQYSGLENSMDYIIHGVTKSRTRLTDFHFPSPLLFGSLLSSATCKASSDNHFACLLFFFFGIILFTASCTILQTSVHSSPGTLFIRSNPLNQFVTSTAYS